MSSRIFPFSYSFSRRAKVPTNSNNCNDSQHLRLNSNPDFQILNFRCNTDCDVEVWDEQKIFDDYAKVDKFVDVDVDSAIDEREARDYYNFDGSSYLIAIGLHIAADVAVAVVVVAVVAGAAVVV